MAATAAPLYTPALIGGIVGGVVAFIIIVAIIVIFLKKGCKRRRQEQEKCPRNSVAPSEPEWPFETSQYSPTSAFNLLAPFRVIEERSPVLVEQPPQLRSLRPSLLSGAIDYDAPSVYSVQDENNTEQPDLKEYSPEAVNTNMGSVMDIDTGKSDTDTRATTSANPGMLDHELLMTRLEYMTQRIAWLEAEGRSPPQYAR
ncbi:hypothetical protein AAF712_009232 [Marasmius tenuissimus]|uniref:Uncharacterized protein n=1 Tax=Marasmius tenuissimus TaxID=585030 RepID=A0ABR2ZR53_9AGAR